MSIPNGNAEASSSTQTQDAHASVLMPSESIAEDATHIKGPNFDNAIGLQELLESYEKIGFQATGMAKAIAIVEKMVSPAILVRKSIESNRSLIHTRSPCPFCSAKLGPTPTNLSDCSLDIHPTSSPRDFERSSVSWQSTSWSTVSSRLLEESRRISSSASEVLCWVISLWRVLD